jgi:uncharacterized protein (TIGR03067 family)
MRRTVLLLAGVLSTLVVLGSDSPREYDDKTGVVGIEGTWRLTEIEVNGRRKAKPNIVCITTFRGDTCTSRWSDGSTFRERYCIDSAQKPSHLDLIASEGASTTRKCIYQIDGDTLRVESRYDWNRTGRPQRFNEASDFVLTYKRIK